MTAEIKRLANPMQAQRRNDAEFAAVHATYYSIMLMSEIMKTVIATYMETLKLYGLDKDN